MKNAIVDLIHIALESDFETERILIPDKLYVVHLVNYPTVLFFLFKKGNEFISNTKYQFINHCEKSFELIHPSILNIVGYLLEKPYLYYYFFESHKSIDSSISDVNIQKIFFGIASGLSYLLSKGYYCSDFSISSVIFDRDYCPKLFDYINIEEPNKNYENDLIRRYVDVVNFIINEKMKENSNLQINEEFQDLLRRANQPMNLPSFIEFINFFQTKNYCTNVDVINTKSFEEYLSIFKYVDKIIYEGKSYFNNPKEEIYRYFYFTRPSYNSIIDNKSMIYLNSLTDNDIKKISAFYKPLSYLEKFLVYEDLSLIIPDWTKLVQKHSDKNPIKIYNELMKHIKILENEKKEIIHLINKKEQIEHKIDALRIQAIFYLKKAYKMPNNSVKIKIELATQYVNGSLLPYNLTKAINILKEINDADKSTQKLINQMIEKIESVIQSSSIKKVLENIPQEQREIYKKATEDEDILSLLFCGFAFYSGFNGFPIMHILSIQFYRKAAKKSAHALTLLGQLYLKGIIFPQNFQRAKNCFRRAAEKGDDKADILDCLLRRHIWRRYLMRFDENMIIRQYLPSLNTPYRCIMPLLIFRTEKYTIQKSRRYFYAEFKVVNDKLHSERINENSGTFLDLQSLECHNKMNGFDKIYHYYNSLLTDEDIENTKCVNEQMFIAKSYYYGINGFPVNYSKSATFFKLASENGDSEAQWRYAILNGQADGKDEINLNNSSNQNNLNGMLLYAFFLKNHENIPMFEKIIKKCCDLGSTDAMYYYAIYLENIDKSLDQSIYYYTKAANEGHFYSLIRLIYILKYKSQIELYEKYLNLSVSIMNESLLIRLINKYDSEKKYDQSNILIQMGIKMNYQLFNSFYVDHLLYGKGINIDEKKAEKFIIIANKEEYKSEYWERYIYLMLEIFIRRNQHEEAVEFLLKHECHLTEKNRKKFLAFYIKIDKILAKKHFITVNFCYKKYHECQRHLFNIQNNDRTEIPQYISFLHSAAFGDFSSGVENPYAIAELGHLYKQGKYVSRDLKKAIQLFVCAAKCECPLGYYYLGKEYYYGRFLDQNLSLASSCFLKAFKNFREPRSGYFIYKTKVYGVDYIKLLKISAYFGYRRALYKYGHLLITGKNEVIKNEKNGIELIRQAALQNYKKAKSYCKLHKISLKTIYNANDAFSDINIDRDNDGCDIIDNDEQNSNLDNVKNNSELSIDVDDENSIDSLNFWF